jgi:hypothetical protein
VIELLVRWRFEAVDEHALRVDSRHHVLDRAVLAGSVHSLQDEQTGVHILCGQPRLISR